MAEYDLQGETQAAIALAPVSIATDTTTAGLIIDTLGYESIMFAMITGVLTDGDYLAVLHDGDTSNLADAAVVSGDDLLGTLPNFDADTDDATVGRFGYRGKKRYVRVSVTSSSTSTGALVAVLATLGHPKTVPVAAQTP